MAVTKSLITSYSYNGDTKPIYLIENHDAYSLVNSGGNGTKATYTNVSSQAEFFSTISDYVGEISAMAIPYPDDSNYSGAITLLKAFFPNAFPVPHQTPVTETNTIFAEQNLYTGSMSGVSFACNYGTTYTERTSVGAVARFVSETNLTFQIGFYVFDTDELRNDEIHVNTGDKKMFVIQYSGINFELKILSSNLFFIPSQGATFFNNKAIPPYIPIVPSNDPYGDGGYSGSGGGPGTGGQSGTGGNYDTSSDAIPVPSLPSSITTGSGLFTAYNPSASQLTYFANKLWNRDPTTIDDWFRMLFGGDAFNSIIGLTLLPVQPSTGSSKNILLGNWDTGASAPVITNQYVEVNFGSLTLSEFWGNSIDYSPYTRVQLALPYIGIVDVDTDDVIGSVNTLTYHIDVFSGAICAMLHCVKGNLASVIYQWSGSCGVTLPITGQSFNAVISAIMGVGAAALGGMAMASGPIGAAIGTAGSLAVGAGAVTGAAANMFGTMKGKVQKSGSFNASSGALGIMTPYFIITRPVQSIPSTQQATKGYPSNISAHLGDLSGYTEVTEVHLHNIPGTKDEVLEIESLLKKGVIF